MYIYESHMGGLYSSEYSIPFDRLYCDTCGDSDRELGRVNTVEELVALLADDVAWPSERGGWDFDYFVRFLDETFPDAAVTKPMVKKLIGKARRADNG